MDKETRSFQVSGNQPFLVKNIFLLCSLQIVPSRFPKNKSAQKGKKQVELLSGTKAYSSREKLFTQIAYCSKSPWVCVSFNFYHPSPSLAIPKETKQLKKGDNYEK